MALRGEVGRESYSGKELEVDVFGKPKFNEEYVAAYKRLTREKGGYLPYGVAQKLIREFYPEDPTNPTKEFARDLRLAICEELGLDGDDADAVRFYSALGTPLDHFHGVDAWVEIDLDHATQGRLHAQVTLDVTKREDKAEDGHKADVMVGEISDPEAKTYLSEVERYAKEVTEYLFSRLQAEAQRGGFAAGK